MILKVKISDRFSRLFDKFDSITVDSFRVTKDIIEAANNNGDLRFIEDERLVEGGVVNQMVLFGRLDRILWTNMPTFLMNSRRFIFMGRLLQGGSQLRR